MTVPIYNIICAVRCQTGGRSFQQYIIISSRRNNSRSKKPSPPRGRGDERRRSQDEANRKRASPSPLRWYLHSWGKISSSRSAVLVGCRGRQSLWDVHAFLPALCKGGWIAKRAGRVVMNCAAGMNNPSVTASRDSSPCTGEPRTEKPSPPRGRGDERRKPRDEANRKRASPSPLRWYLHSWGKISSSRSAVLVGCRGRQSLWDVHAFLPALCKGGWIAKRAGRVVMHCACVA